MMKVLIFVAALFYLASADTCAKPADDKCDPDILRCCDANFKTALNITCAGKAIYENPDCINDPSNNYFINGESGALTFCNYFNTFRSCLGASARSCTTYEHFLENNATVPLAQTNQGLYAQLGFMCGAGLDTYLRNTDQVNPLFVSRGDEINQCAFKFITRARRAAPGKSCPYLKEYASCLDFIFNDYQEFSVPKRRCTFCSSLRRSM